MNKIVIFMLGAAVGGCIGAFLMAKKTERDLTAEFEEELEGMKEYYERKYAKPEESKDKDKAEAPKEMSKSSYADYISVNDTEKRVVSYHTIATPKEEKQEEETSVDSDFYQVSVITQEEYNDDYDNGKSTLYYFEPEHILVNLQDNIMDSGPFETVLDSFEDYDDYRDQVAYGRDIRTKTDYEIFRRTDDYHVGKVDELVELI